VVRTRENPLIHFIRWRACALRPLGLPLPARLSGESSQLPTAPDRRHENIDITVFVHKSRTPVRVECYRPDSPSVSCILVDDGSDVPTVKLLVGFAETYGATLLRNEVAKGYTSAANAGLRASSAPFCVLLNSDTEESEGWLDRLVDYVRRDRAVGVVGPLSNTASWQSVPTVFEGDWGERTSPGDGRG
jgi:GT2 family glycosyltransferase